MRFSCGPRCVPNSDDFNSGLSVQDTQAVFRVQSHCDDGHGMRLYLNARLLSLSFHHDRPALLLLRV